MRGTSVLLSDRSFGHCGSHGTCSSISTIRSAMTALAMSPPRAASLRHLATCRHVSNCLRCAGTWLSRVRTSASVRNVMTVGIFSGRGRGRDQFGRDNVTLLIHSHLRDR